jgi:hypothetical protein
MNDRLALKHGPLPALPEMRPPHALEERAVRSATRAMPRPHVRRLPDLALALYGLGELVPVLRVVRVLP